jgi:hypothetical protein
MVFKTIAFGHSATSPESFFLPERVRMLEVLAFANVWVCLTSKADYTELLSAIKGFKQRLSLLAFS